MNRVVGSGASRNLPGAGAARFSLRLLLGAVALAAVAAAPAPETLSAHDRPIVLRAFEAADRGEFGKALALAQDAGDKLPLKILQWLDLERPFAGHDFAEVTGFVAANPDWPHQAALRARAEENLPAVPEAALRAWWAQHPPATPQGRLRQADFLAADGKAEAAQAQIREVWTKDDFAEADEQMVLARYGGTLRPEDHVARLDRLLWEGKIGDAERLLPRVPEDWRLLADARIKLAASAKSAEAAMARVPAALQSDPGLLFEEMRWYRRQDRDDAALAIFDQVKTLGRPDAWWPDRQALARHLLERNETARAYKLISAHGLSEGPSLSEAEFAAGWIALRFFHDPATGYSHFTELYDRGKLPLTLSRAAYWAGRAADAEGQNSAALGWFSKAAGFRTTYYGQLAASVPNVRPPEKPEPEPKASAKEAQDFDRQELVRAVLILNAIGWDDKVKTFLNCLSERAVTPSQHALVADLAEAIGRPDLGVLAAKKASYAGVSLLRAGYPLVPMPRNAGAEQALLLALTRQESAFDLHAVSNAGALGLMQLMPATAKTVATKMLQLPYQQHRLTEDATYNVTLGQAYVDSLLTSFNGSYVLAIAAYNAGPGRVRQWLDEFGDPRSPDIDAVDWVELIPFSETRNYVQRVLENLQVYRLRIGDKSLAFSLDSDLRR